MSDMLNEKFEEFVTEQKVIVEAGDPMPTVSANVIPGTGSEPSQVSDAQTAKAGGKDPAPTVQPSVAPGQSAAADLGGSTSAPPNDNDEDGEENPGAKAAAPISQDGDTSTTLVIQKILCQQLVLMQHTALPRWAAQLHIQSKQVLRSICQQTLPHF